jgi:glycerol-3-phosphate acyltransferase PlsY
VSAEQVILVVCAYLGGSLPFGYWAGRLQGIDIRTVGSGNTGATNVWRVLGKRAGIPVLVLDIAKGFVPALIGLHIAGPGPAILAGAAAAAAPGAAS